MWHQFHSTPLRRVRIKTPAVRPRVWPFLRSLEDRIAPANLVVTDAGDNGGAGQLRAIWETARTNGQADTITFDSAVTSISLASALNSYSEAKDIAIVGNGKLVTTINAPANNRIFNFAVAGSIQPVVTISDMTLKGGSSSANGGAILDDNETLILTNLRFTQNTAAAGGALATVNSYATLKLTGCDFTSNTATQSNGAITLQGGGGGLYCGSDAIVTLTSCTFDSNVSASTGGAFASNYHQALILNSDSTNFTNNVSLSADFSAGGAIHCGGSTSTITIDHALITGNSTASHGGAFTTQTSGSNQVTIKNSTISSNTATDRGGAIHVLGSTSRLILTGDVFAGNTVTAGTGGAIYGDKMLNIADSIFANNKSFGSGGAIYVNRVATISQSAFSNNAVTDSLSNGGAIYIVGTSASISSCDFDSNVSASQGGGVAANVGTVLLENSTFRNNIANGNGGGGLWVADVNPVTVNQCSFAKNTATGLYGGGGIYLFSGSLTVNNSTIYDNTATGSSTSSNGGGLTRNNGTLVLQSTIIAANKRTGAGTKGIDIWAVSAISLAGNNSLIGTNYNSSVTFTGTVQKGTNAVPVNPLVNALADNGGVTLPTGAHLLTMSLKSNSPAIDTGSNTASFASDQRGAGFDRIYGPIADVGAFEAFGKYPHASLTAGNVPAAGSESYSFVVIYADSDGGNINTGTIATSNVTVTGSGFGTGQNPTSVSISGNGNSCTATYTIPSPAGGWGGANFGAYTVALNPSQVQDADDGFYAPARTLGTFKTAIPTVVTVDESSDLDDGNYTSGHLSLREAIKLTNANVGADTINFSLPVTTVTLNSGLTISDSLTLIGPRADKLTINANNAGRHFTIDTSGLTVLISGLTLTGGSVASGQGGALFLSNDTVTLDGMWLTANTAGSGGAISVDPAIYPSTAYLTIRNSTLSSNTAGSGGAVAVINAATLVASNSTFSGNIANGGAGGAIAGGTGGSIVLKNSTVTGNSASKGGGISVSRYSYSSGIVNIESTILSGNTAKSSSAIYGPDIYGNQFGYAITSKNSIIGVAPGFNGKINNLGGTQVGTQAASINAKLDPLAFNAGPMPTHRPQPGSPALDLGSNPDGLTFDQRGPGHPRVYGSKIDIGAYEASHAPLAKLAPALIAAPNNSNYNLNVVFSDEDTSIDTATFGTSNVTVTGNGFGAGQQPIAFSVTGSGKSVTVTYTVPPPFGGWANIFASYPVTMNSAQVFDTDSPALSIAGGSLGAIQMGFPLVVDENSDLDDGDYGAGHLSLREAVKLSNNNTGSAATTITFDAVQFNGSTITLSNTLTVTQSVAILGPGADKLVIDANKIGRHFTLTSAGMNVTISGLTLTGGSASGGGAILINNDTVTLDQVWLKGNTASGAGGGAVGFNAVSFPNGTSSSLAIKNSTVSGNSAANSGGAVYFLRGLTLLISNSTLSANTASTSGGAIGGPNTNAGSITIKNSTVTGNSSGFRGGGIRLTDAAYSSGLLSIESTILSGNTAGLGPDLYGNSSGPSITSKNSLIGRLTHGTVNDIGGSKWGTSSAPLDAKLDLLANYGGALPTHRLQVGSPAANAGSNPDSLSFDQRGAGYVRTNGAQTDMGAFEIQPPTVTAVTFGDGTPQRSLVKQLIVTFSEPVSFMGDVTAAFTVHRSGTNGTIGDVALSANPATGPASSVTITFSGALTENASLVDGLYNLIIGAAQVSGTGGALDGNSDGIAGGDYTVTGTTANKFFRLYGDQNGDATTDQTDYLVFRNALSAGPSSIFDFDNSGDVDQIDYLQFRNRIAASP
ncbi:MAG: beta strand repeat-containing protein [Gemmataceae bacterium]